MIANKILKDAAKKQTIAVIEEEYKLDIEEIFDAIKRRSSFGKFYCRYQITDRSKTHSLEHYMKCCGYACSNNCEYAKDDNGKVLYDNDGEPIKSKIWLDIWWS